MKPADANMVFLGDSITWLGGDDCSGQKGWTKWFVDIVKPQSARSFARSGATWTHTDATQTNLTENVGCISDCNVISNQIERLKAAVNCGETPQPDIIIIAAGTNDAWLPQHRPHALDNDTLSTQTLQGAVNADISNLKQSFPSARIILLTPLQSTQIPAERIATAGNLIENAAHKNNVCCIRQDSVCPLNRIDESKSFNLTYDGTHTSQLGAQKNAIALSKIINSKIKEL